MAASTSSRSAPPATAAEPMQEMNITPLIDVMLVLLIMFIITIPLQTHAVKLDIGTGEPTAVRPDPVRNRITVDPAGTIRWNGAAIDRLALRANLAAVVAMPMQPVLELQPDAQARYAVVDAVLSDIKRSGAKNLGFVGNEHYAWF